jgi:hypothetical protein
MISVRIEQKITGFKYKGVDPMHYTIVEKESLK